jgi:predicted permease
MSGDELRPGFRITEHGADAARDARDEIAFHLTMRERELVAQGLAPEEAKQAARAAFGDVEAVRARLQRMGESKVKRRRLGWWLESWGQDMRHAVRMLGRSPRFALVAVLILALGIGANVVIFSLIEAALLRAPAVARPEQLVSVWTTCRRGGLHCSSSFPDYEDYRSQSTQLRDLAAYTPWQVTLDAGAGPALAGAELVTGNYFTLLGLTPRVGRLLQPRDDAPGNVAVAVLSHHLWRTRFGGAAGVVGRSIRLNGVPYEVVGVAPAGFDGLVLGQSPDVWLPMHGLPALYPAAFNADHFQARARRWIAGLVGRLSDDGTEATARADLARVSDRLFAADSLARGPRRVTVAALQRRVLPGGTEEVVPAFLGVLQGVVALTLLLACASLANLLLARATVRRGEMGVRLALGVSRGRLLRLLLTESVLLALVGASAALAIAALALRLITHIELPLEFALGSVGAALNLRVALFTLLLALVTGLSFGAAPALIASAEGAASVLRESRGSATMRTERLRSLLVSVQLALGVVLLVGAGLFLRTLRNRLDLDLGFPRTGLALLTVLPSLSRYTPDRTTVLARALSQRSAALAGVTAASVGLHVPVRAGGTGTIVAVRGYEPGPGEDMRLEFNAVAPGFLRALGLPVLAGRDFTEAEAAAGDRVIVIDESAARRWWQGRDPVGGIMVIGQDEYRVVGVARSTAWGGLDVGATPYIFLPIGLELGALDLPITLLARTAGDARALIPALRSLLTQLDPGLAVSSARTMQDELAITLSPLRAAVVLLSVFGGLALVLAVIAIYGVVSYVVAQRRRDLAVRLALGATPPMLVRLIARRMLVPVGAGLAAGVIGARLLSVLLTRFLYGVPPTDVLTHAGAVLTLALAAVVATLLPAREAAHTDVAAVIRLEA